MNWMNEYEIETAVQRFSSEPKSISYRAAAFLAAFRDQVNENSDGWAHWDAPAKAANLLMSIVKNPIEATEENYRMAMGPIKSFYTRRGTRAGMKFPVIF